MSPLTLLSLSRFRHRRLSLRGRGIPFKSYRFNRYEELAISTAYQKCLDILDQRSEEEGALVGAFHPGLLGRGEERGKDPNVDEKSPNGASELQADGNLVEMTKIQSRWWGGNSSSAVQRTPSGGAKATTSEVYESFDDILKQTVKELKTNERAVTTIKSASESLLEVFEHCEDLTDPEEREYLEAGLGFSIFMKKKKKGKKSLKEVRECARSEATPLHDTSVRKVAAVSFLHGF